MVVLSDDSEGKPMKEFKDKVAVITGAASGIGRALADQCSKEGMKIVLADIDWETLKGVENELRTAGTPVTAMPMDVSKETNMELLARKAYEAYKDVHLLFNNAGVGTLGLIWEHTIHDWEWILRVNLWSIIHSIRIFVPKMLAQDTECHIVNTASAAGLITPPLQGPYNASKQAVVSLSESLYHDLYVRRSKIKVSVLCPGIISTNILDCEKHRPEELMNQPGEIAEHPEFDNYFGFYRQLITTGMPPSRVAELVFNAIKEEKFYIHTHEDMKKLVERRMEDIIRENKPRPAMKVI
jgi:short-subunit dehydrogenase